MGAEFSAIEFRRFGVDEIGQGKRRPGHGDVTLTIVEYPAALFELGMNLRGIGSVIRTVVVAKHLGIELVPALQHCLQKPLDFVVDLGSLWRDP